MTARRLVSYNLSPALKNAFEQIFSAPLLFRGILAELGATPAEDMLWCFDYDGSFNAQGGADLAHGAVTSGPRMVPKEWSGQSPRPVLERGSLKDAALSALKVLLWAKLKGTKDGAIEYSAVPADLAAIRKNSAPKTSSTRCSIGNSSASPSPIAFPARTSWDFRGP